MLWSQLELRAAEIWSYRPYLGSSGTTLCQPASIMVDREMGWPRLRKNSSTSSNALFILSTGLRAMVTRSLPDSNEYGPNVSFPCYSIWLRVAKQYRYARDCICAHRCRRRASTEVIALNKRATCPQLSALKC